MTGLAKETVEKCWPGALAEFPFELHEAWAFYETHAGLTVVDESGADVLVWRVVDGWMRPENPPARPDPSGTAQPRTSLHAHVKEGRCFGPGSTPESYELRDHVVDYPDSSER